MVLFNVMIGNCCSEKLNQLDQFWDLLIVNVDQYFDISREIKFP